MRNAGVGYVVCAAGTLALVMILAILMLHYYRKRICNSRVHFGYIYGFPENDSQIPESSNIQGRSASQKKKKKKKKKKKNV
jgi:hypothetical protein